MEKELFLQALWLTKPWYVKEFKLDIEKERLDIYLDFEKWTKFKNVDWEEVTANQTVTKTWKHLFFWHPKSTSSLRSGRIPNIFTCKST